MSVACGAESQLVVKLEREVGGAVDQDFFLFTPMTLWGLSQVVVLVSTSGSIFRSVLNLLLKSGTRLKIIHKKLDDCRLNYQWITFALLVCLVKLEEAPVIPDRSIIIKT